MTGSGPPTGTALAELDAARAAVRQRALDLEFTIVRSPIAGQVSDKRVSLGDNVTAGQTLLTRVVTTDPIWFSFDGAESFYLKYSRLEQSGERRSSRHAPNPVEIQLADEPGYRWRGRMVFVDNAIDEGSGTIRAHAEVANPDGFLVPGLFGRARLLGSGTYHALLIPDEAIVTDQTRRLVYVTGKDGKVATRNIETGPLVEGLRVVKSGLQPRDQVVLDGLARLQPGARVRVKLIQIRPRARNRRAGFLAHRSPASCRRDSPIGMRFPHFFIRRPIFAAVLSILIVIVGVIAYPTLPVAQYPEIAPPTVVVSASYPGASAETLAQTVATPLEESINGVEDMIYMSSSSTGDGKVSITVTFAQGTDVDQAQVLVQNRVSTAEPRLPEQVRQIGVTVRKNSPDLLMAVTLVSPDHSLDKQYLSNYATLQIIDRLQSRSGRGGRATVRRA